MLEHLRGVALGEGKKDFCILLPSGFDSSAPSREVVLTESSENTVEAFDEPVCIQYAV